MENKKSAPKTKENTVKSKNTSIRVNDRKPKTAASIKSASVPISAVDTLKRRYVKGKAELQKQTSEQTERPENYAVDTVEDKAESAAYLAADTVKQSARYVKNSIRQYRVRQSMPHDMPMPDIMVRDDVPQPPALNAPKTKELSEGVKAVPQEQKIKNRQQAAAKAKQKMAAKADIQNVEPVKIKTKTEYLKNKSVPNGRTYKLKSDVAYKSKSQMIKPKTLQAVRARQAEIRLNSVDNKNQAARKYVQNKLKTKAAEIRSIDIQPISDIIPPQAEIPVSPKQKPKPQEQIKVKKTDVKTKNSYIHSHSRNMADVKTKPLDSPRKPLKEKQLIKYKSKNTMESVSEKTANFKPDRRVRVSKPTKDIVKKSAKTTAVKTQKQVTKQAAKQAAKRAKQLAQRSAQVAKAAAKATVRITKVVVRAAVAAAKALISALVALGGWAVLLVVLIVVIIMAAIAASPFGIFFSEEATDAGSIPLSQIIAEYNVELTQETENVELAVDHTEVEVIDNRTDNNIVIAIFAAKLAGTEDDTAEDVVIFDDSKAERLKEYFRSANAVAYETEESGSEENPQIKLTITIEGKTKDELMDEYGLTDKQREAVETLLEHGDVLTSSSHSLAITDADVQSIINGLPDSLPQKRKDVVKNAGSLVGKVNYFWGGYAEI